MKRYTCTWDFNSCAKLVEAEDGKLYKVEDVDAEIERLKAELKESQSALRDARAIIQKGVLAAQGLPPFVLTNSRWKDGGSE